MDVLVSFNDRRKVFSIPEDKSTTDLEFLRKKFCLEFDLKADVFASITFQRYDDEWKENIEIGEDSIIHHKDKLTVVVEYKVSSVVVP